MTIVSDILYLALKDSGAFGQGQVPSTEDVTDALRRTNMMISQWNKRRWLVYHLLDTAFACTGAQTYSVGPGENFNIVRPDKLEAAYIRQLVPASPTPVDFWLTIIQSREDYARLTLKQLAASPSSHIFYDSDFPNGTLYPVPIPSSSFEIHILTKAVLQSFATIADTVNMPPEYEEAIYFNLMVRLRIAYRKAPDASMSGLAKASLNTLRRANFQIARLQMPAPLNVGPTYNILSDQGQ